MAMLFYSDSGGWDPERKSYIGILLRHFSGVLTSFTVLESMKNTCDIVHLTVLLTYFYLM